MNFAILGALCLLAVFEIDRVRISQPGIANPPGLVIPGPLVHVQSLVSSKTWHSKLHTVSQSSRNETSELPVDFCHRYAR